MRIHTILSVLTLSLLVGCSKDTKASESKASESGKAVPFVEETAAKTTMAKLEKADAADGKTDKIVSKCPCGMEGKKEFALEYQGYTLHMCGKECLETVKKDPAKAINDMKLN